MTKLLSISVLALLLAACQQAPTAPNLSSELLPMGQKPASAHPALTWLGGYTVGGGYRSAIYVADTDVSHITAVQISAASSTYAYFGNIPGWSPTGGSICFTQRGVGSWPDSLKAFDVSVDSKGVAVGSNLRTIVGLPNQTMRLLNGFWSSTSTTGKIAYLTRNANSTLWVVSQSGGTPTNVFSVDTAWAHDTLPFVSATWSPDDSRLAVGRVESGGATSTIMIFNTSTWAYVDSIAVSGAICGLEWSRTGLNKLAFGVQASGGTTKTLYYCTPTTGSTPTTNSVAGSYPTWAPDNSSLLYVNSGLYKNSAFTASTSYISSFSGRCMKWKR